jgi:hypothetical protein
MGLFCGTGCAETFNIDQGFTGPPIFELSVIFGEILIQGAGSVCRIVPGPDFI